MRAQSVMVEERSPVTTPHAENPDETLDPRRHADFVWRALQRHGVRSGELDDALQEVFLVAHRRRDAFDPSRGKFTTWLFGICTKVAWAQRRRRPSSAREAPELIEHDTPEAACGRRQYLRLLSRALDELPPEHRATFFLFELEGQSCAHIAELCGVPIGTVYSRLHTARATLRSALQEERAQAYGSATTVSRPHQPSSISEEKTP